MCKMTIKHLVFSGGGPILLKMLGAIQHLEKQQFLDMNNIESIYGTSAGAMLGILICLKFDWETINDYIIKRPWHDVFIIKVEKIFEAYAKKGIFDSKIIEKCFKPLFDAKDISLNITLKEFFELSKIELHMISFDINEYATIDVSYLNYPDLPLLLALQMTCGIPVLIKPVCIDDGCYIDGGVSCNYPLNYCINSGKNIDEILGFKNKYAVEKNFITETSNIVDFLLHFLFKAILNLNTDKSQPSIKFEVTCCATYLNISVLHNTFSNIEIRKELFNAGIEEATEFLKNRV